MYADTLVPEQAKVSPWRSLVWTQFATKLRRMVLVGVSMFAFNWLLAWSVVRGHADRVAPILAALFCAVLTLTIGFTLAIGYGAQPAHLPMDAAVFFGLPAAAWATWCAAVRNRRDVRRRARGTLAHRFSHRKVAICDGLGR